MYRQTPSLNPTINLLICFESHHNHCEQNYYGTCAQRIDLCSCHTSEYIKLKHIFFRGVIEKLTGASFEYYIMFFLNASCFAYFKPQVTEDIKKLTSTDLRYKISNMMMLQGIPLALKRLQYLFLDVTYFVLYIVSAWLRVWLIKLQIYK